MSKMEMVQIMWTLLAASVTCLLTTNIHAIRISKSVGQQRDLYDYLFRNYTPVVRPVLRQDTATNVSLKVYFKQVLKVSESDQILKIYLWIEQYWVDEYLRWNPDDFDGMTELHVPAELIWKPDLTVYNNANMNVKENELQTNALVNYVGNVSLYRAVITDITCALDMEHFPFDQQFCHIMIASWSLGGKDLNLNLIGEDTITEYYTANLEWSLNAFRARKNHRFYDCCPDPYPDISFYFVIRRNPVYYMLTLIVPSAFITIVTVVGFFTPHSSSGENTEKVSLGVTALLSLAIILMMVSDKLPATSKVVPLLGQYYVGLILIMFMATCATTITLTVQMKGNGGRRLSPRYRRILHSPFARLLTTHHPIGDRLSNRCSRSASFKLECSKSDTTLSLLASSTQANGSAQQFASNSLAFGNSTDLANQQLNVVNQFKLQQRKHQQPLNDIDDGNLLMQQQQLPSVHQQQTSFTRSTTMPLNNNNSASTTTTPLNHNNNNLCTAQHYITLVQQPLKELAKSIQQIGEHLAEQRTLGDVRGEWQQMARLCDRVFMLIFIMITVCFASWMVYDNQTPILITQSRMDGATKMLF